MWLSLFRQQHCNSLKTPARVSMEGCGCSRGLRSHPYRLLLFKSVYCQFMLSSMSAELPKGPSRQLIDSITLSSLFFNCLNWRMLVNLKKKGGGYSPMTWTVINFIWQVFMAVLFQYLWLSGGHVRWQNGLYIQNLSGTDLEVCPLFHIIWLFELRRWWVSHWLRARVMSQWEHRTHWYGLSRGGRRTSVMRRSQ